CRLLSFHKSLTTLDSIRSTHSHRPQTYTSVETRFLRNTVTLRSRAHCFPRVLPMKSLTQIHFPTVKPPIRCWSKPRKVAFLIGKIEIRAESNGRRSTISAQSTF